MAQGNTGLGEYDSDGDGIVDEAETSNDTMVTAEGFAPGFSG